MRSVTLFQTTEQDSDAFHSRGRIIAHPDVGTRVNGEYLILSVDVVYDIGGLDDPFGVHPARGAPAHTVRRHYGSHLCSNLLFSCEGIRRPIARRVNRDLARLARRGVEVVNERGGPFSSESVTSLVRW